MDKKKVSIVIPIYNTEKYLEKCIDSIINQSYQNIEIILVNDGSKDNSKKICDNYAQKDNRIKVIHQSNNGVSIARNNGIMASSGEYICFIDPDDYVDSNYIKKLMKNAREKTLSVCQMQEFKYNLIFNEETNNDIIELDRNHFIELSKMYLLNTPCCKIFNLNIIKDKKICFNTNISLGEDVLFNLEYLQYIDKILVIKEKLYYYRRENNSSLSTAYNPKMCDIQLLLFDKYTNFFNKLLITKEDRVIFDSTRFIFLKSIVTNGFKNKKISFWKRYFNTRKQISNDEVQKRMKEIRYLNLKKKFFYFLISHKLILLYKITNKIRNIVK